MSHYIHAYSWAERENLLLYAVMIFVKWRVIAVTQKTNLENALLVSRCDSWSCIVQCSLSCQISNIEKLAALQSFLFQNEQLQFVDESYSENRFTDFLFWASWHICYTWEDHSLKFICYSVFQHNFEISVVLHCFCLSLRSASLENL